VVERLSDVGERKAIASVQEILGPRGAEAAKGDDAAVVRAPSAESLDLVATTDTLTYALHRFPGTPLRLFGYYACAVSISDLASMGAKPRGMLIAVGLPGETAFGDLKDMALGFRRAADQLGFDVWGGDLKQALTEHITTTAIGEITRGRGMRRKGIKAGWTVGLTGFVGRAAMGARLAGKGDAVGFDMLYGFEPRVEAGRAAAALTRSVACIDTSDGLSTSLDQLARATPGIGFEVDWESLPLQPGLRKAVGLAAVEDIALHWGGDFELVLCAPPRVFRRLKEELARLGCPLTAVGRAVEGGELQLVRNGNRGQLAVHGFEHFRSVPGSVP
jgi:thiamine-monophosphate kinase